jgi:hypothetical protein
VSAKIIRCGTSLELMDKEPASQLTAGQFGCAPLSCSGYSMTVRSSVASLQPPAILAWLLRPRTATVGHLDGVTPADSYVVEPLSVPGHRAVGLWLPRFLGRCGPAP